MFDIPTFIFLSVTMVAFGYAAGNAQNFNKWKLALLALILIPFFNEFNFGKAHLITILGAFLVGYLLPYAYLLEGFGEAISDAINAFRYRDAWEDIKRKEAEVEKLRGEYEKARKQENGQKREQEFQKRKQQSQEYRKSQQGKSEQKQQSSEEQKSKQEREQQSSQQHARSTKEKYLRVLGLDPDKEYTLNDIKKAFRKLIKEHHPDPNKSNNADDLTREKTKKTQEINETFGWLGKHVSD